MGNGELAAVETWLYEYFEVYDDLFVSWDAIEAMSAERISMPDLLCVLRNPTVTDYERDWSGCIITVKGRTCDDEEITVFGGFNSETYEVSVFDVARTGHPNVDEGS